MATSLSLPGKSHWHKGKKYVSVKNKEITCQRIKVSCKIWLFGEMWFVALHSFESAKQCFANLEFTHFPYCMGYKTIFAQCEFTFESEVENERGSKIFSVHVYSLRIQTAKTNRCSSLLVRR